MSRAGRVELGLRHDAAQLALLVAVDALVGGMLCQERTVLPLPAERAFGLDAYTAVLGLDHGGRRAARHQPGR